MPKVTNEKFSKTKKSKKKSNKAIEVQGDTKDNKFSFDDEIVIGLKRLDEPVSKEKTRKHKNEKNNKLKNKDTKKTKKNKNVLIDNFDEPIIIKSKYMSNYEIDNEKQNYNCDKSKANNKKGNLTRNVKKSKRKNNDTNKNEVLTKKQELLKKKKTRTLRILKWFTICGIIAGGIIYAMLSPIFNIKTITVLGNSKISSEAVVSLSRLNIDQNIFNFSTSNVKNEIKQNPYIGKVDVKRKFPDTVEISVNERIATYMLTYGNAYVYIDNQGYILEITSKKEKIPIIEGYDTPTEKIIEGNRLCIQDLEKLNDVLKIMEAISSGINEIEKEITKINIKDKTNYILTLEKEKKSIYLGDSTNLSNKVLWINKLLEEEKKNEGIIYLNVNLNTDLPYFREKV